MSTHIFDNLQSELIEGSAWDQSLEIELVDGSEASVFVVAVTSWNGTAAIVDIGQIDGVITVTVHRFADYRAGEQLDTAVVETKPGLPN